MRRSLLLLLLLTSSGCVVAVTERRPAPPERCVDAVWIAGHYGPRGHWHPGHWRCD